MAADLVDRCRRGDQDAWRRLVDDTHREVYALCFRILGNDHDALEATQDAYVKAWRGLGKFRGEAQFTTWLYRIATNAAISRHRTRSRRRSREVSDETLVDHGDSASVEAAAELRLDLARLEEAVAGLSDEYRIPLVLRDVYGMSIQELARQVGISETAAKVRIHRARRRLRDVLTVEAEEG